MLLHVGWRTTLSIYPENWELIIMTNALGAGGGVLAHTDGVEAYFLSVSRSTKRNESVLNRTCIWQSLCSSPLGWVVGLRTESER